MPTKGGGGFGGGHSSGASRPSRSVSRPSRSVSRPSFSGFRSSAPRSGGFSGSHRPSAAGRRGGCGTPFFLILLIVGLVILYNRFSLSDLIPGQTHRPSASVSTAPSESDIPKSSKKRTKLSASQCTAVASYLTDDVHLLLDPVNVRQSMEYFYEVTGVQPYLYLIDTIDDVRNPDSGKIEDFAFAQYRALFGADEGHLLVVYVPFTDYRYDFYAYYLPGDRAASVIDEEAGRILLSCLDVYTAGATLDEAFARTFRTLADRLNVREPPATIGGTALPVRVFVPLAILVVLTVTITVLIVAKKRAAAIDDRPKSN